MRIDFELRWCLLFVVWTILSLTHINNEHRYKLLRDRLSESKYMEIVRNKILVDIQGKDVLYQIFTGNVRIEHTHH